MALNWDDLVNSRRSSSSKPSWDELVSSRGNFNSQPKSWGETIPSGYEGTIYEGMTNDQIIAKAMQEVRESEAERKRKSEEIAARNRAYEEAQRAREEQRKKDEIQKLVNESKVQKADRDNPSGLSPEEKAIAQASKEDEPQSKGWFLDLAKGIKDTIVSVPTSVFSTGVGIGKKLVEADQERKQAINTNEDTKNLSALEKTGLFIGDYVADLVRDVGNGFIGTAINVINFLDPDKNKSYYKPLSIDDLGIKDFSPVKNNEQFGQYESKEALQQAIQQEKKETYKSMGIYNPTANTIGEIAANVLEFAALKKVGLGNTSSAVTSSVVNTLGATGDISQSTKSGISSYVFGEMLSNSSLQNMIKNPTTAAASKISEKLFEKFPSLANSDLAVALNNALPNVIGSFNSSFATRALAGEAGAIIEGEDMSNADVHKQIIGNALLWSAIYEGLNGVSQVKYELNRIKLDSNHAKKAQLKEWYNTLGVDSKATDEEIKSAYRKLAKANHPDRGGDEELFKKISMAYDGITEYRKSGNVYQTTIKATKTNSTPEDLTREGYTPTGKELWVKDNSVVVNTGSVLSDVYTAVTNAQNTIIPITSGNEVVGLQKTIAVPFEVKNNQVPEIQPAVVLNDNNTYNTIDVNTGTTLIANKPTAASAIEATTKALQTADQTTQKEIQTNLDRSKMATKAAVDQLKDAINTGIAEANAKNVLKPTETNEVGDIKIKGNETTNDMSQQNKTLQNNPGVSIFADSSGKNKIDNSEFANSLFDNNKQYKADDIKEYYYDKDELILTTDDHYIDIGKVAQNKKDYVEVGEYNIEDDELVDRVYIPVSNNGNVSGSALNTAIRKLTTDTSNAPIGGQMDIEGNQVYGDEVDISNKKDYNGSNLDLSKVKEGDLVNDFYGALTKNQWRKYHEKMNKVMDTTYGDLNRCDSIDGKFVITEIKDHKEQVVDVLKVKNNRQELSKQIIKEANKHGYNGAEMFEALREVYGEENVNRYDSTSGSYNKLSKNESVENNGRINQNGGQLDRTTTKGKTIGTNSNEDVIQKGRSESNGKEKRLTSNEQKISGDKQTENTRGKGKIKTNDGSSKKELSEGIRNYEEKGNNGVKIKLVETDKQSPSEQILAKSFKEVTGLDLNIYQPDQSTSEGAFYSTNNVFLKHNPLANKKSMNFRAYHELGHWLQNNFSDMYQDLKNVVEKTITPDQVKQYKDILNNSDNMSKNDVIIEITNDYLGNWANNIENWLPFIETKALSQEYMDFLADIELKEEKTGYNLFGTLEQQKLMDKAVTDVMKNVVGKDLPKAVADNKVKYSDRKDVDRKDLDKDSNGKELTKQQQEYFKDSKARNDNGELEVVYHTTTDNVAQFNEFNPVGTPYYRFGDQIVNFYTNSKDMSGSYANSRYEMADTTKISNIEEAKKWINKYNKSERRKSV